MAFMDYIYITKERAIENGLTHNGKLYGVPSWVRGGVVEGEDGFYGVPKVPLLQLYLVLAESLMNLFTLFLKEGAVIEAPIRATAPIMEFEHKGYRGSVQRDLENGVYHGKMLDIPHHQYEN